MKRNTTPTPDANIWDAEPEATQPVTPEPEPKAPPKAKPETRPEPQYAVTYDMEGLMNDFPTAKELERFVFDETGYVLNLKGRANKLKYQIAMDTLNGITPPEQFLGRDNPYVDRTEMVPVEDLKQVPERDASLPPHSEIQNQFVSRFIPHPDPDYRAQNRRVDCVFRKYRNGMISYEILGPLEQRPHGEKMDKFGRMRPEVIKWVDPRTGEQVIVRKDGTLTPTGRNLRAIMQTFRVNNSNQWNIWVDRDFVSLETGELANPWGEENAV